MTRPSLVDLQPLTGAARTAFTRAVGGAVGRGVHFMPLREPLPPIRVPLRETDADVTLDLQSLIDQCYRNGRYDRIDYRADLIPPVDPEDAAWVDDLLRGRSLRG
jgi:hypothetical protein